MSRVLAFDLGASSGRAMLGEYVDGQITMEEIHRFANEPVMVRGTLYWDVLRLFHDIQIGITRATHFGGFDSIGIDTWGVDFGLVRPTGQLVGNPVHYRDRRTDDYEKCLVTPEEAYKATGVEIIYFNTLYQLNALARKQSYILAEAGSMLLMPDLLNFMLCGNKHSEYTIASTTAMLNAKTRDWDLELIRKAGISERILCDIVQPGTICGELSAGICEMLGAREADVMCIASHDTASAVAAVPTQDKDFIFISCGTWSLLGTVLDEPLINEKAFSYNFTNEGAAGGKIQFLKNIMGTWLIQESRRQWGRDGELYGYDDLETMARQCTPFMAYIDVDMPELGKPGDVPALIRNFCKETGQPVPGAAGEIVRCIDESLAMKFRYTVECLKDCTGKEYKKIYLMGGGSKSALLCQMTANATGLEVIAGPDEATVLGNMGVQLIGSGDLSDLTELRAAIAGSATLTHYMPAQQNEWDEAYKVYKDVILDKRNQPAE